MTTASAHQFDEIAGLVDAGRAAFEQGDVQRARRLVETALATSAGHGAALNLLGSIHFAEGRVEEAERCYRTALNADATLTRAHFNLGLIRLERGDRTGAIRALEEALAPGGAGDEYLLLGNLLHSEGRVDDAIVRWRQASDVDPALVAPWVNRGSALRAAGRTREAREALARAAYLQPDASEILNEIGLVELSDGRPEAAVERFRVAVARDPRNVSARINLGDTLRFVGSTREARELLEAVAREQPESGLAWKALGLLALVEGRGADAAKHYQSARRLLPDDPEIVHLQAAIEGAPVEAAPAGYVRALFDTFAPRFDEELTQRLCYRTPEELADALRATLSDPPPKLRVADLGCGTGLVGTALGPLCATLAGVDLSPRMLDLARARGLYDELACMDLVEYLDAGPAARFDAVVAADVFIYVGRLDAAFAAIRRTLATGGRFAFSVEVARSDEGRPTVLRPSGRFAHRLDAVRSLAERSGFETLVWGDTVLRYDRGQPVPGHNIVLGVR